MTIRDWAASSRESHAMQDSGSTPENEAVATVSDAPAPSARSALIIVFLVMFIDLLGFGIVLPLLPVYGRDIIGPLFPENKELTHIVVGLLMASFSLMQFIFAPIWGRISDRAGRRPFLMLGLAGSVVCYALFGFASDYGRVPGHQLAGLVLLFASRIGAGIAGATVSTAQAVIADSTTPEHRSHGMALIGAAFGAGFTLGPAFAALILLVFPNVFGGPGYLASCFSLIALILAAAIMPETVRPGGAERPRKWFNFSGIRLALETPTVATLMLIFFLSVLAFATFEPTLAYLNTDVLGYEKRGNALVFCYVGLVLTIDQGFVYRRLARRGITETTFIVAGTVLMAVGLGGLGGLTVFAATQAGENSGAMSTTFLLLVLTVAVTGFSFVMPSVQALVSRRSDPRKQGEILGVNQSANAMSRILGPFLGTSLYGVSHVLPCVLQVSLLVVVLLLIPRVRRA
jgi:DHA1 family tetracycline resistance protein-like MFS transporter